MNTKKMLLTLILAALVTLGGIGIAAQNVKAATIAGSVDNVTSTNVTIEGLTILTDNNTIIKGTIAPGVFAKIQTTTQTNGLPLAIKIEVKDNDKYVKLEGSVDNVTGNKIIVNGQTVFTDNNTRIEGTLAAGVFVEIKARTQNDGSLLALKIEVEDGETNHGKYIKIRGTTANLTSTSLVVNGKTIQINEATKTRGNLTNGTTVKVQAITQSDGSLLAVKIKVDNVQKRENKGGDDDDNDDDNEEDDEADEAEEDEEADED